MIESLVNRFTSLFQVKMPICWHWSLDRLAIIHLEFLENILCILFLMDESPFLQLLDLKPRKKLSSPIMDISNSLAIISPNSLQRVGLVEPKMISSTVECLVQPINMIRISRVLKPGRLFNKHQLINRAI